MSPYFLVPVCYAYVMSQSANYKFEIKLRGESFNKNHPKFNAKMLQFGGNRIKNDVIDTIVKQKIRKDVIIFEAPMLSLCGSAGTNCVSQRDAAIHVAPGFYDVDPEACRFIVKLELCHVKNNWSLLIPLAAAVCAIVAGFFCESHMSPECATIAAAGVAYLAVLLFCRLSEQVSEDFAIENSTPNELLGGRRIFLAIQMADAGKTVWERVQLFVMADNRFDFPNTSLTTKIKKVDRALEAKGIVIEHPAFENDKVLRLKEFVLRDRALTERVLKNSGGMIGILRNSYGL